MTKEENLMSSKDNHTFDVADFWLSYLNGPDSVISDEMDGMDENPNPIDVDQTKPFKG